MAHYAKLNENNIVLEINVIDNGQETELGEEGIVSWLNENFNSLGVPGGVTWKKTSYNTKAGKHYENGGVTESADQTRALRKNYAASGDTYDSSRDAFITPKNPEFTSWILNETTCQYEAPVAYPNDGKYYKWNEATESWDRHDDYV